jgi:murein DD-endopeptidase MepM/ murein hydrolase activator NlpD
MARSPLWVQVPMALAGGQPVWPLPTVTPKYSTSSFGGGRPSGCADGACERWHAGIDLTGAPDGAVIVAPEAGTVVGVDKGWSGSTKAIYLRTLSNLFLVLGGSQLGSSAPFGVAAGTQVEQGQPLGRIRGAYGMLHFETYKPEATKNYPWYADKPPPALLLNPTGYVEAMFWQPGIQPPAPQPGPHPPPAASSNSGGIALFVLLAFGLYLGAKS